MNFGGKPNIRQLSAAVVCVERNIPSVLRKSFKYGNFSVQRADALPCAKPVIVRGKNSQMKHLYLPFERICFLYLFLFVVFPNG